MQKALTFPEPLAKPARMAPYAVALRFPPSTEAFIRLLTHSLTHSHTQQAQPQPKSEPFLRIDFRSAKTTGMGQSWFLPHAKAHRQGICAKSCQIRGKGAFNGNNSHSQGNKSACTPIWRSFFEGTLGVGFKTELKAESPLGSVF